MRSWGSTESTGAPSVVISTLRSCISRITNSRGDRPAILLLKLDPLRPDDALLDPAADRLDLSLRKRIRFLGHALLGVLLQEQREERALGRVSGLDAGASVAALHRQGPRAEPQAAL